MRVLWPETRTHGDQHVLSKGQVHTFDGAADCHHELGMGHWHAARAQRNKRPNKAVIPSRALYR